MRTFKLTLAYDGTAYVGWQRQASGASIQGCLEAALGGIAGAAVAAVGAGRTDAGVHALGQVAGVRLDVRLDPPALARAVNARLPADVRVVGAAAAGDAFHARFDAVAKSYRYRLLHGPVMSPFLRRYAWHVREPLDAEAMTQAGGMLVGEHDFAGFQAAGSGVRTTVRTLFDLSVRRVPPGAWADADAGGADATVIEVRGSGFLRHMVRTIVGTLVEVGRGRRGPADLERVLRTADRRAAGPTASAGGLFLTGVAPAVTASRTGRPAGGAPSRSPPHSTAGRHRRPGREGGLNGTRPVRIIRNRKALRPAVPSGRGRRRRIRG